MKIVSLFTKAPGYKRFSYEPRFYDQRAEEMKEREARILQEIERERGLRTEEDSDYRSRMTGAFKAARKRSETPKSSMSTALIRLGVLLFLSLFIMAFLTWGTKAFYSLLIFAPIYFYFKFRNQNTSN
jgi:hypothetical protein